LNNKKAEKNLLSPKIAFLSDPPIQKGQKVFAQILDLRIFWPKWHGIPGRQKSGGKFRKSTENE
jgi:hypothetical protein